MRAQSRVSDALPAIRAAERPVLLRGSSMRFLESGLAILAIVTAVLLGQIH